MRYVVLGFGAVVLSGLLNGYFVRQRAPWVPPERIKELGGTGIIPAWNTWLGLIGWSLIALGIVSFFA